MSNLLDKVCKTIQKHNLLVAGDKVLVCLSGGADSVCLLKVLNALKEKLGITLFAAHLNHMLRGDSADKDEDFAKNLCKELGISFFSKREDVLKYAKENNKSTEEAGRILRYKFFDEICAKYSIDKIATAHNKNDNCETVLMRFIRGTGIFGLAGIPYKNQNIIRPILDLSREEIENYLFSENQSYVTDKTNFEPIYYRNKVRLSLIPEIEKDYNPNFSQNLSLNISNYKDAVDFLKEITKEKTDELVKYEDGYLYIEIDALSKEADFVKSSVIYSVLESFKTEKQTTAQSVNDILNLLISKDGTVDFSKDLYITALYGKLFFVRKSEKKQFCYELKADSDIYIKEYDKTISFKKTDKKEKRKNCIYLDFEKIGSKKISVRNRLDGDVFVPSGMENSKKLKNYFIDEKVPNFLRDSIPIVVVSGEIASVGTMRESEKYKASGNTKEFLRIEISGGGNINDTKEC